jgi:N6-adenosine-specific RNA methylase IME4
MIEDMFPNLPRIELFARERIEGWDAWGQRGDLKALSRSTFWDRQTNATTKSLFDPLTCCYFIG